MNTALRKALLLFKSFFLMFAYSFNALLLMLGRNAQTISFPLLEHFLLGAHVSNAVRIWSTWTLVSSHKKPTICNRVVEFIIPMFLNCSTCFGRHTAHDQELKNCNYSLWFYIRLWLPAAAMAQPSQRQPATKNVCKTRGCNYSFWAPDHGRCVARNLLSN